MGKRNLPVKIFSKREILDEYQVEGMGSGELPRWSLSGKELISRVEHLDENIKFVKESLKKRRQETRFIPIVVTAKINEDAIAKSHRRKISQFFNNKKDDNVIGLIDRDLLMVKLETETDLDKVSEKLKKFENNIYPISAIEDIEPFKPKIQYTKDKGSKIKVKLLNYDNYELDSAVSKYFEKMCYKNSIKFEKSFYTENMEVYKITCDSIDSIKFVEEFEGLLSMSDMPTYTSVDLDFLEGNLNLPRKVKEKEKKYPIVGIMDTGIERNNYLDEWLLEEKDSSFIDEDLLKKHGTFVAGIVTYGDQLEGQDYTGVKGCEVFDSSIFSELEEIDQDTLVRNIESTLRRYGDKIKIWNLSIGTKVEADVESFSDLGIALDNLQDKYDVIICKSAGNSDSFINGCPKERISKSADSIRSIVVGSIAQEEYPGDLVEKNYPSPFTRIGRGPGYIIKPDLVHYGGNARVLDNGEIGITGVKSFSTNGNIIENVGTSFSTPRVSSILAGIQNELTEEFDPLLIKGLAIHSAKYPENVDLPISEKINQMGFGVPAKVDEIIYNTPNEITLIMRDQINKGEYIDILDFPYPNSLVENGVFYGQIIITAIYNPILDESQGAEYCQSDLKVALGTYDEKILRDISKSYIKNEIGKKNGQNILKQSCYSKKIIKDSAKEFGKKERLLIQYGDKYYPVKKYAVDLDEMTPANREKYLNEDRKWYLKIEGLFREAVVKKSNKNSEELYEDFCLLITIRDPRNSENPIYNEVSALLNYHNFYHSNIGLRENVNISVEEDTDDYSEVQRLIDDIVGDK